MWKKTNIAKLLIWVKMIFRIAYLHKYLNSRHIFPWNRGFITFTVTLLPKHYSDVIMGAIASQITSLTIVYSIVYSDADQRKHQSPASLAFVRGMLPFDDVIMIYVEQPKWLQWRHMSAWRLKSITRQFVQQLVPATKGNPPMSRGLLP